MGEKRELIIHNSTLDLYGYENGSLHSVEVEGLRSDGRWETVYQLGINGDFWSAEEAADLVSGLLGSGYRVMVYTNIYGEWSEELRFAGMAE